jgi:hypothetical protein
MYSTTSRKNSLGKYHSKKINIHECAIPYVSFQLHLLDDIQYYYFLHFWARNVARVRNAVFSSSYSTPAVVHAMQAQAQVGTSNRSGSFLISEPHRFEGITSYSIIILCRITIAGVGRRRRCSSSARRTSYIMSLSIVTERRTLCLSLAIVMEVI